MSEGFTLLGKQALVADYLCAGLAPQEKALWHDLPQKAVRQPLTIAWKHSYKNCGGWLVSISSTHQRWIMACL